MEAIRFSEEDERPLWRKLGEGKSLCKEEAKPMVPPEPIEAPPHAAVWGEADFVFLKDVFVFQKPEGSIKVSQDKAYMPEKNGY